MVLKNNLVKTFDKWGPDYRIEFEFRLKPEIEAKPQWYNMITLTKKKESSSTRYGHRIPAVFLQFSNGVRLCVKVAQKSNQEYKCENLSMDKWYKIQLHHTADDDTAGTFKWFVNADERPMFLTDGKGFDNVLWYQSSPWFASASEVAEIRYIRVFNHGEF